MGRLFRVIYPSPGPALSALDYLDQPFFLALTCISLAQSSGEVRRLVLPEISKASPANDPLQPGQQLGIMAEAVSELRILYENLSLGMGAEDEEAELLVRNDTKTL